MRRKLCKVLVAIAGPLFHPRFISAVQHMGLPGGMWGGREGGGER